MQSGACVRGVVFLAAILAALPLEAATVGGRVSDSTGAALPGARVVLRGVATGQETVVETDGEGRFILEAPATGTYLLIATRPGFSEVARTVVVTATEETLDVPVQLNLGGLTAEVTVTAARAERESRQIPLHVESLTGESTRQTNPVSTGDVLSNLANITPVGNGPFGIRPRVRGLDSTRLLVLVDGERLNTARQATDRTGAEVGLISPDAISRVEIVNGAGTVLYGSDALAGTINVITNEPTFSDRVLALYGVNGFYSSNENGRRATATLGITSPRYAVRLQTGTERFDNYKAGALTVEDTRPMFADGRLRRGDTVDDAFGFAFASFPDPFNAPYVRTDREIASSGATGHFVNLSGLVRVGDRRTLRLRYQARRMDDIGFPDFAQPYFFNATSLPQSDLDRASARYEAQAVTPWLANLSVTAHYQRTDRVLQNLLPVQFPAPTPVAFFPITVFRLDILSQTEQRVWSPGVDVQAVLTPVDRHVLTTGLTFYRDRSSDVRTTSTTTSMAGQVALGARGPAPVIFPSLIQLGLPAVAHPVRVPDARLRDIALFAQDEWRVLPRVSLVAGMRGDFYRVTSEATPGYDVSAVVAGARPAIDPTTLPSAEGTTLSRNALTGDVGLVFNAGGRVSPFARFGRSYRHPNLEELFYAGPATAGNIAPNIRVKPETGNNVDLGATVDVGRFTGGAYFFVNQYRELRGAGPRRRDHAGRTAGPGHQLRGRAHPRPRTQRRGADRAHPRHRDAERVGGAHARDDYRRNRSADRPAARWGAGGQHHAGQGSRGGTLHGSARPMVGRVWSARPDRCHTGHPYPARVAVPHRAGFPVARWLCRAASGLGRGYLARAQQACAGLCDRESRKPLLPRTLSIRAGARAQLHDGDQRRRDGEPLVQRFSDSSFGGSRARASRARRRTAAGWPALAPL